MNSYNAPSLIAAELIYDYSLTGTGPSIPTRLLPEGPAPTTKIFEAGQFQGTSAEKLAEICGRSCYDSFGKGRTSEAYHAHILQVGHGSVHEHFNFTVEVEGEEDKLAQALLALSNRPGVWVIHYEDTGHDYLRITLNMRSVIEWHAWSYLSGIAPGSEVESAAIALGSTIRHIANKMAPHVVVLEDRDHATYDGWFFDGARVVPEHDEEKWITMLLTGSRGFSHELVRHGDRTAISQRSTRYVDESASPWVWHPLLRQYIGETSELGDARVLAENFQAGIEQVEGDCKRLYGEIVETLQPWMKEKLIEAAGGREKLDKGQIRNIGFSARKQARGAARGFLGNALYTEVVFSASVAQWNRILRQRAGVAADAEIRQCFVEQVLPLLKGSEYGDRFEQWEVFDCEDGIGQAAREGV